MNKLVASYVGSQPWTEQECLENFSIDPDMAIANIYSKYFGMLYTYARKFPALSKLDIESLAFESIHKSLSTYTEDRSAKFATYLTRVFRNRVLGEYRYIDTPTKSRGWYLDVSFDSTVSNADGDEFNLFTNIGYEEDFSKIEIDASLEYVTLSANEYGYVAAVLERNGNVSDAEIARELGVSRAAISGIKKRLKVKLKDLF